MEPTDFKNVNIENIHWALSEDAEVAEVKQPWNSNDENSIMKSDRNGWRTLCFKEHFTQKEHFAS